MFSITDKDITATEGCLLQEGQAFDIQRREFIKCTQSVNVLACPGSGKTTALVAKLLIIAEQLPIKGNQGVCVLTHTNVAIDTIKDCIGRSAGKLFSYPNFFGTIQSFVDKYLAIPAFIECYGKRPDIISNDWYHAKIDSQCRFLGRHTQHFCHKGVYKDYPRSIRFCDLEVSPMNKCKALGLDLNVKDNKQIYDDLVKLKTRVMKFGILSYDDAYHLATGYLDKHPSLTSLFSHRFRYVFIDEMQDTDSRQIDLLDQLFDNSVVIQKIGDINQAIFGSDANRDEECRWKIQEDSTLEITGSKRFSTAIATIIAPICVRPQGLVGNCEVPDLHPTIIAFDDKNIQKVIPRFADLIFENQLHLHPRPCFKAVGWTGKGHATRHTVPSYWPLYQKELHTKGTEYPTLAAYIQPQSDEVIGQNPANHYRKTIIRGLLKCLRIADRPSKAPLLSERALFTWISNIDKDFNDDLKLKLAQWCLAICRNKPVLKDVAEYIRNDLAPFFDIPNMKELEEFLTGTALAVRQEIPTGKSNTYIGDRDNNQIEIEICTIHAAKGQTHTATLYLETFYRGYDILRIIDYLKGKHTSPNQKLVQNNLNMAYVGMSRPAHLLCVAVHNAHLSGHSDELRKAGWEIDGTLVK